jgi:hypothetical protein
MKQSILLLWLLLSLAITGIGQPHKAKDIEIPILNLGTAKWPLKLTKQSFEGDTIYNLTFRDAKHNSAGKISTQGFFLFELKAFEEALQTALSIDSGHEIHFKEGAIEIMESKSNYRCILVRFRTGTGSFITTEGNAIELIYTINRESRVRNKISN